ncbi:MAG: outer membrane lipoprotein carrier protein LolA [Candidatus Aminicenantales bacterium]
MKRLAATLIFPLILSSFSAEDVALRVEEALLSLQTLKAEFIQTYIPKSLTTQFQERGELYFQKKGLMKWVYEEPEEKIFLVRGSQILFYLPEENQLIKSSLTGYGRGTEILDLLSGNIGVKERFQVEFTPPQSETASLYHITLTPKEEGEYTSIYLEVEKKSWLIRKAVLFDWAGNRTEFRFNRIKTNIPLPETAFELKVPPDVEIIEEAIK